jgi:hypothetical protein
LTEPTRPGQRCRVIGTSNGTAGHTYGKEVVTVFEHDQHLRTERGGIVVDMGPVWRVRGENLISEYGGAGDQVDCLAIWLEVIDDPDNVDAHSTNKELEQQP